MSAFHDRLRTALTVAGSSASALSERTGISESAVSHFTCGRREPSLANLAKILSALPGVDARWLIIGSEDSDNG